MSILRSARFPAVLLLSAAVVGPIVVNAPVGPQAIAISRVHLGIPDTVLDLSLVHWVLFATDIDMLALALVAAALVPIPAVSPSQPSPAFSGILVAPPVGKLVGIAGAGWIAQRVWASPGAPRLALGDLMAAGTLGGIGFAVSLLLANLAFAEAAAPRDEATLGELAGSLISVVVASVTVGLRARAARRSPLPEAA